MQHRLKMLLNDIAQDRYLYNQFLTYGCMMHKIHRRYFKYLGGQLVRDFEMLLREHIYQKLIKLGELDQPTRFF